MTGRSQIGASGRGAPLLALLPEGPKPSQIGSGVLTGSLGEVITVTRASTKYVPTALDESTVALIAANLPAVGPLGLLIEADHTNLLQQSQALATAPWATFGAVVAAPAVTNNTTDVLAPDGTFTATKIVYPATTAPGHVSINYQPYVGTTGVTYTFSAWVRGTGPQTFFMSAENTSSWAAGSAARTISLTSQWRRVFFSFTPGVTVATNLIFGSDMRTGNANEPAMAAQTVYVWGVQLETGTFAHSYVPTAGASATGNKDVVTLSSSTLPIARGSVELDYTPLGNNITTFPVLFDTRAADGSNGLIFFLLDTGGVEFAVNLTAFVDSTVPMAWMPRATYTLTARWGSGNVWMYRDGVLVGSDTSGTVLMPSAHTILRLGDARGLVNPLDGYLSDMKFFST